VDAAMVKRTANWLFSRRDGKGGFGRNPRALHEFGLTDEATMSIYITWALTQAKFEGLQKEIDFAFNTAMQTKNPYQLGLTANMLYEIGDKSRAKKVLEQLMSIQLEMVRGNLKINTNPHQVQVAMPCVSKRQRWL
ncbi:MAG: hypothetical protein HC803_11240, partial [Saprospiraceae bacterium]|nr:hypothetical protein [Saprospiraceae bacterium]